MAGLAILVTVLGGFLKYLVWDFFNMPQTLHERYFSDLSAAQTAIHQNRFLPPIVEIFDSVETRKKFVPAATTMEILVELPIDAKIREARAALLVGDKLDRSYQKAMQLCPWIAVPWLVFVLCSGGSFWAHFYGPIQYRWYFTRALIALGTSALVIGIITLGWFSRERRQFVQLLGRNRL
jgi:hypothetical protein